MLLDAALLYKKVQIKLYKKVQIKGKVEQSRKWSSALPYNFV